MADNDPREPGDPGEPGPDDWAPDGHPAPDTVVEAMTMLRDLGYRDQLDVGEGGLVLKSPTGEIPCGSAVVDHVFRFEGESNPSDMSIVVGISCRENDVTGVLVSAYGPDMDPDHEAALRSLDI